MNKFALFTSFFFCMLFICSLFCSVFASSELTENSWTAKASMNQARYSFGVVTVEGKIYAIGGVNYTAETGPVILDTNECYDPVMDTWITLEPMPTAREGFAIAVYEGKIYCIGGFIIDYSSHSYYAPPPKIEFSVNEVYDPITDSWSTKASMPVSKSGLQAHVVDGKIFVIANDDCNLFRYDPATDKWTEQTSVPSKYGSGSNGYLGFSTILDNKILVLFYQWDYDSKFLIYDPKIDKWSDKNAPSFMAESSNSSEPVRGRGTIGTTSDVYAPQRVMSSLQTFMVLQLMRFQFMIR